MKRTLFILLVITFLFTFTINAKDEDKVRIHGVVTYFDGTPVDGANVELKVRSFHSAYATTTNEKGEYELLVKPGRYFALFACKDYVKKNLEFWAWNIFAYEDQEINARIDRLELYAMNAFMVQGTPSRVIFIYFRPMGLSKIREWEKMSKEEQESAVTIDIAPTLEKENIQVSINGEPAEVFLVDRILEQSSLKNKMFGYIVQVKPPANWPTFDLMKILVTIKDSESGDQGEGCVFLEPHKKIFF